MPLRSNYGVYTEKGKQHEETDFMFGSYLESSITLNSEKNSESGKVYVKGKAAGKYTCDRVAIKIVFYSTGVSGAKASETVMTQCEKFLERLEESGIDISVIQLHDDSISQPSYGDEEKVKVTRTIEFDSEAKASVNNFVLKIIQEEHLEATVYVDYYLSNEEDIRKKLKEMAIVDSKDNAELLARAAGKKIACVYTIDMINHRRDAHLAKSVTIGCGDACSPYAFSERLSMPEKDIEETVEATWLIE